MTYVQLYIPLEISREVVCILGNLGNVMFRDLNSGLTTFQRGYIKQIRKFDDVERLVQYMQTVAQKHSKATWKYTLHSMEDNATQHPNMTQLVSSLQTHSLDSINDLSEEITEFEARVKRLDDSLVNLKHRLNSLIEHRHVLFECGRFLEVNPGIAGRVSRSHLEEEMAVDDFRLTDDEVSES